MKSISIVGIVGVPGNYGGFETLAENLVKFHANKEIPSQLTVYCSSYAYHDKVKYYHNARLVYLPVKANGVYSVLYDSLSIFHSVTKSCDTILLLGVSGALVLPFLRFFSKAKVVTNVDGIEWKRSKWNFIARSFLKYLEGVAVRCSDVVIADNKGIAEYINDEYGGVSSLITYGGDHALCNGEDIGYVLSEYVPDKYILALCRIEPENNVSVILDACSRVPQYNLVFVGNWSNSSYGKELKKKYSEFSNIFILDPVYDIAELFNIRKRAFLYLHGHSAGGTNPSLVEMMHFGVPIASFDCVYNRSTTYDSCFYFNGAESLHNLLVGFADCDAAAVGDKMKAIAGRDYMWDKVSQKYFDIL